MGKCFDRKPQYFIGQRLLVIVVFRGVNTVVFGGNCSNIVRVKVKVKQTNIQTNPQKLLGCIGILSYLIR